MVTSIRGYGASLLNLCNPLAVTRGKGKMHKPLLPHHKIQVQKGDKVHLLRRHIRVHAIKARASFVDICQNCLK